MKWIKAFLKTMLTAIMVFILLFAAVWLLMQSRQQYRYANRIERLRDEKRPYQAPKYFIELHPEQKLASAENNGDIRNLINNVPTLSQLTGTEKFSPLPEKKLKSRRFLKRWKEYGRPFEATRDSNKIAVIFINSGFDQSVFEAAIESVPENIAFSFSPYADAVGDKIAAARRKGHETYADILLPENSFLEKNNGPASIGETAAENYLEQLLKQQLPLGGIVLRGTAETGEHLQKRAAANGMLVVGTSETDSFADALQGEAFLRAALIIDSDFYPEDIKQKIDLAAQLASEKGQVLIIAEPKPSVITALIKWIRCFDDKNNFELVPPTALIEDY